jgi:hypothetical protein
MRAWIGALSGMGVFWVGAFAYLYMCLRNLRETDGRYGSRTFERYQSLVNTGAASVWPKRLVMLSGPLGIVIIFSSILLSK